MSLVFAAIAPHGGIAIAEACSPNERLLATSTRAGMEELGRLFAAARPDAVVVATPHNVHISNALGVVVAGRVTGRLAGAPPSIALDVPAASDLAWLVLDSLVSAGLPAVGVSRVAFIASADHGHAHLEGGPYGYHANAAVYDAMICELVRTNRLEALCDIEPQLVEQAKADSWWQILMLHGATPGWTGRLISYEAPTYFGMLTAAYLPGD